MWWLAVLPILKKIWAFIQKYAIYFLIGSVLASSVYFVYHKGYTRGYSKGYAQCAKDRPTYGTVGTVNNLGETDLRAVGIILKLWFLRLKLGV
ncbi:MAG: hypothetical protein WC433_07030 [Candidatus Omnitrophota bacterium]|jgi:hypothetical protein